MIYGFVIYFFYKINKQPIPLWLYMVLKDFWYKRINKIIINNNETFLKTQTILLKKRLKKY